MKHNPSILKQIIYSIFAFSLIIYLGFWPQTTLGQNNQKTGIVKGHIYDSETNESLIGANIYLKSDLTIGTTTNDVGNYALELKEGTYELIFSYTGMKNEHRKVIIEQGTIIIINLKMLPFSYDFEEITVSAGRYERSLEKMKVSTEVISAEVIESKNTINIESILKLVPGVNIVDEEPQIRGGSGFTFGVGSKVGVYLNDMPIITATAGKPNWSLIPVENIKQVEVIKGTGSVLTGASSMSGAMYFRTQYVIDNKPRTVIRAYAGMYTAPKDETQKWWDGINYISGLSFLHAQKLDSAGQNDLVVSGMANFERGYQGAPKPGIYAIGDNNITDDDIYSQQVRINVNFRRQEKKIKGLSWGINGSVMYDRSPLIMAWFDDTTGFYRGYPGASFLQEQTIFYFDPFVDLITDIGVHHHLSFRIMNDDSHMSNNQSVLTTSFFGMYQFAKVFHELKDVELIFGASGQGTNTTADIFSSSGSPKNDALNVSIYAEMNKQFGEVVNFSLGLRGEYYDINKKDVQIVPLLRTSINFKVMKETYIRMSFGQGFRYPTIAERFISTDLGAIGVFANPDLLPEKAWNGEIGVKHGFKFSSFYGFLDLAAFIQEYNNTIEYLFGFWDPEFQSPIAGFKFVNTGKSKVSGLDASINGQSIWGNGNSRINFVAGYTYILPVALEPNLVFATDYRPGGDPDFSYNSTSIDPENQILKYRFQHTFKMDIEYFYKFFSTGISVQYYSRMANVDKAIFDFQEFTEQIGGSFPPILYKNYFLNHNSGHTIVDWRFGFKIKKIHKVSFIGNNIFNRYYSLRPLKADPMRSITLQYIASF
jgi:iron complex outermembrane receptor protein